ncbi:hypothetical protein NDN08_006229 [Rhodosorus marinus]|uniref:HSF-type DNA-binding domain-containing protein n=1 Tax=Rhodosorus marinus TaxID=101924 RepID=A0AAV8UN82_9RHOD|nr:hypothetical protein NDN08_006229 [Rhodosorus marinus]
MNNRGPPNGPGLGHGPFPNPMMPQENGQQNALSGTVVQEPVGLSGNAPSGTEGGPSQQSSRGHAMIGNQGPPPFLTKLYDLVDDPRTNELVSWSPDGRIFTVHKTTQFERDVLPKYFKHNNFSSFVRQLNQYGFHKQDPDNWTFGHESFQRGRPDLLVDITRKKPKNQLQTAPNANMMQLLPGRENNPDNQKLILELGNYGGILGEVDRLQRDRDTLLKELMGTRKQLGIYRKQETQLKHNCEIHEKRIERLEANMKKMQQFLYYYFQPVLKNYGRSGKSRRRRLPAPASADDLQEGGGSGTAAGDQVNDQPGSSGSDDEMPNMFGALSGGSTGATPFLADPILPEEKTGRRESNTPLILGVQQTPSNFPPALVQELSTGDSVTKTSEGSSERQLSNVSMPGSKRRRVNSYETPKSAKRIAPVRMPSMRGSMDEVEEFTDVQSPSMGQLVHQPTENGFETVLFDDSGPADWDGTVKPDEVGDALPNFLDLDVEDNLPPLNSLPQGTDMDAFAQRMEDFQESTY